MTIGRMANPAIPSRLPSSILSGIGSQNHRVASTQTRLHGEVRIRGLLFHAIHTVLIVLHNHSVHRRSPECRVEGWTLLTIVAVVLGVLGIQTIITATGPFITRSNRPSLLNAAGFSYPAMWYLCSSGTTMHSPSTFL